MCAFLFYIYLFYSDATPQGYLVCMFFHFYFCASCILEIVVERHNLSSSLHILASGTICRMHHCLQLAFFCSQPRIFFSQRNVSCNNLSSPTQHKFYNSFCKLSSHLVCYSSQLSPNFHIWLQQILLCSCRQLYCRRDLLFLSFW